MAEQWWAIYEKKTGKLISTGTTGVLADDKHLKENGLAKKKIRKQPDDKHIWDEKTLDLVEAPKPLEVEHNLTEVPTETLLEELKGRLA
jgi:hypothetical protein